MNSPDELVARLRNNGTSTTDSMYAADAIERLSREKAEQAREIESLKADAERYRWLMQDEGHNGLMATLASLCATNEPIKPQMDAAIDAALRKEKP